MNMTSRQIADDAACGGRALFDSGHTVEEIEAILTELLAETTRSKLGPDDGLIVAIELGLLEGDVVETSAGDSVILPEPWSVIEARLRVVRDEIARGASIHEAIEHANALGRTN